jgi:serine/threonine-protein kinase RsbW
VATEDVAGLSPSSDRLVQLEISSCIEMLELVDQVTEQAASMAGFDADVAHGVSVAVREAVANGIKHGNAGDERKHVRIEYEVARDESRSTIVVRIRDEGAGFEIGAVAHPRALDDVSSTSGRGLLLMRAFMDDVDAHRAKGGGAEIVLRKTCYTDAGGKLPTASASLS